MKPVFKINRLGAQDKVPTVDTYVTKEVLDDIANRLIGKPEYEVIWIEKRIKGRLITLETDSEIHYICLSQNGHIRGRDYQIQSIPTALSQYLKEQEANKKKSLFHFYFMPFDGNNNTPYMQFFYRMMKTAHFSFINADFGLPGTIIKEFASIKDVINARNGNREVNSGNQSTYVTDEGDCYHIYGKTFGANQKETTLLCVSLSALADKPIKLFQILDNDSLSISDDDKLAIKEYVKNNSAQPFDIMDDTLEFDDDDSDKVKDHLRSPRFVYNLLSKFGGEKRCALCGCKIESIVQAAHIYPVSSIRKRSDLSDDEKLSLAIDIDNGIWLCENHHKLFDRGLIWFEEGKLCVSKEIDKDDSTFVKQITTIDEIDSRYINDRMLAFFDLRAGIPPRLVL